jgi:acetate kinase
LIPVLTVNAGSSSLKLAAFEEGAPPLRLRAERLGGAAELRVGEGRRALPEGTRTEAAVGPLLEALREARPGFNPHAVAHRVVVGGDRGGPAVLTPSVMAELERLSPLAPLHMPANLSLVRVLRETLPGAVQVGCFDTAFHASLPEVERVYALPARYREAGVRRYGFHGLSYAGLAEWMRAERPDLAEGRVVAAHLGSGASLCAIERGRSVATTMGLTPLGGLPMGTRPGDLDPGALLYLLREGGETPEGLERALYREAGLLGLSGLSSDMRDLRASSDPGARLAVALFERAVAKGIAGMAATMGGADALVLTGGIGENDTALREALTERLAFLRLGEVIVRPADEAGQMVREARGLVEG